MASALWQNLMSVEHSPVALHPCNKGELDHCTADVPHPALKKQHVKHHKHNAPIIADVCTSWLYTLGLFYTPPILSHITPEERLKWPSAITRLISPLICGLMPDWWFVNHHWIYSHTWHRMPLLIVIPYVSAIKQHSCFEKQYNIMYSFIDYTLFSWGLYW